MRRAQGYTLVETMIAVAMVGILVPIFGAATREARLQSLAVLHRERALILLEYQADHLSRGLPEDPAVLDRLVSDLPDATTSRVTAGDVVTLTVSWRSLRGRTEDRSLAVFAGGRP